MDTELQPKIRINKLLNSFYIPRLHIHIYIILSFTVPIKLNHQLFCWHIFMNYVCVESITGAVMALKFCLSMLQF